MVPSAATLIESARARQATLACCASNNATLALASRLARTALSNRKREGQAQTNTNPTQGTESASHPGRESTPPVVPRPGTATATSMSVTAGDQAP